MAEAVFRHLVSGAGLSEKIEVESAGVGNWHAGQQPHPGTLAMLKQHQIEVGGKRARQITRADLRDFNYVVAMDEENVGDIQALFGRRVPRLLEFVPGSRTLDVPDPYYNGKFDIVYELVLKGGQGLLDYIRQKEKL